MERFVYMKTSLRKGGTFGGLIIISVAAVLKSRNKLENKKSVV